MLHFHILLASLFVLSFFTKAILLISGNLEKLAIYKKKTFIVEMIIELLVVVTGAHLIWLYGFHSLAEWFHWKLTLLVIGIPLGVIGFRKKSKILVLLSSLIFIYILILSLTDNYFIVV